MKNNYDKPQKKVQKIKIWRYEHEHGRYDSQKEGRKGAFSGRDDMEITVTGNEERIVLTARFDNLGKGDSGAAIQNMNLILGVPEDTGLTV